MSKTMTLRLDDDISNRLTNLAQATERSKSYLAMQALRQFLENNEWQVQQIQTAVAEADSATADQFVDNESVMDWLESWGTDSEKQPPL